eukprot:9552214-Alexandrium_andersonii.AAC.1
MKTTIRHPYMLRAPRHALSRLTINCKRHHQQRSSVYRDIDQPRRDESPKGHGPETSPSPGYGP